MSADNPISAAVREAQRRGRELGRDYRLMMARDGVIIRPAAEPFYPPFCLAVVRETGTIQWVSDAARWEYDLEQAGAP